MPPRSLQFKSLKLTYTLLSYHKMCTCLKSPNSFNFPFEPYQIQYEFMQKLYEVIENRCLGIFESPTGTGKSLSIICAAIRWLKDHNERERCDLANQIALLQADKQTLVESDEDWISSQTQEIEVNRKLNLLKIENGNVQQYDKKIQALSDKKKKFKKQEYFKPKVDNSKIEDSKSTEEEEDDLLLEELKTDLSENELSDEENENRYEPAKVFICSRTHSQLSQFVGEIIKSPFGDNVRVVTLSSRQNLCINTNVNTLRNVTLINEKCLDLQRNRTKTKKTDRDGKLIKKAKVASCKCEFYRQDNIDELRDVILLNVQDIEDLVNAAKVVKGCPYYASRKAAEDAEVVLIPYNTILHKPTREANGIKLKNNIVIIDEAHNLLEAMAQMYSTDVTYLQLFHSRQQLKNYKMKYSTRFSSPNLLCINQLIFIINKLIEILDKSVERSLNEIYSVGHFVLTAEIDNYNMFKLVKFCKDSKIGHKLHGFSMKHPEEANSKDIPVRKGIKHFLNSIENNKDSDKMVPIQEEQTKPESIPMNPLLSVISFLEVLTYSYDDGRIMIKKSDDKTQRKLQFLLLNATEHFKEVVKEARAVIVAGGTMKPIAEFRNRLFVSAGAEPDRIVEFSCDHIIPPENILPVVFTRGSKEEKLLFNYENRFAMGNSIKSVLEEACKWVKGGIVVFFPSYKYENWIWQQLKDVQFGRPVFREPQQSSGVDRVLESYAKEIRKSNSTGALMFSVVGGKLSEGLNFSDDLGRCVIVVGMPYANIFAADLKEKMAYLDKLEGNGAGQKFYESLCMKAVNQCIGRAVRHKNDYAAVILLDERYNRASTKNSLPDWIKRSLRSTCSFKDGFSLIQKFFHERKH